MESQSLNVYVFFDSSLYSEHSIILWVSIKSSEAVQAEECEYNCKDFKLRKETEHNTSYMSRVRELCMFTYLKHKI